ncbi:MAG TPA: hypothetical protein QGF58_19930 [Myxococcota bacterium]|nr:hypothetical protein [Myxococcota bacterium]
MIDGTLRRLPLEESRRLFARMPGRGGGMWLGVGEIRRLAEGPVVRLDPESRVVMPAWELASGRWPDGEYEVVEFGVQGDTGMTRIAWCRLTGWAIRESRWIARRG